MHLLHVITMFSPGGAEHHLRDLIRAQRERGHTVTVAHLKGEGELGAAVADLGVATHALGMHAYGDPRPALRLRRLVGTLRPTLVHAHLEPAELYTRLALLGLSRRRVPLVTSKHNMLPFWDSAERALTPLARWVGARASRFIAISEAVRQHYIDTDLRVSPDRIDTVHYGLDPAPFDAVDPADAARLRAAWLAATGGEAPGACLVATVARLVPPKALHVLIEAVARARAAGTDVRLVVAGEGPLRSALEATAAEHGATAAVHFAGRRSDVPRVLAAADVFALSSVSEGFGLVLLEAMAARRAVVTTNVSALPEVAVDGETARLVPPSDPAAFDAALAELAADADLRARFGAAGRARLDAHFTVARMAEATDAVYARALATR